jgi:hypothetical protein
LGFDLLRALSFCKVEGTAVYDRKAEKLGSINSVMIDKVSGKVRLHGTRAGITILVRDRPGPHVPVVPARLGAPRSPRSSIRAGRAEEGT